MPSPKDSKLSRRKQSAPLPGEVAVHGVLITTKTTGVYFFEWPEDDNFYNDKAPEKGVYIVASSGWWAFLEERDYSLFRVRFGTHWELFETGEHISIHGNDLASIEVGTFHFKREVRWS